MGDPRDFSQPYSMIRWFSHVILLYCSDWKVVGDGGLKDLLVDSSVYAAGTVDQMLNGKEFNHATRAFALAYEALSVSWLSAFFSWCNKMT